jgi:hypothetical protein
MGIKDVGGIRKPPEGSKIIEEGRFWKLWEYEYEEGKTMFGISVDVEEGAKVVNDDDSFRFMELQNDLPKWQIIQGMIEAKHQRPKGDGMDDLWDDIARVVTTIRGLGQGMRGASQQLHFAEVTNQLAERLFEQEQEVMEKFVDAAVALEMAMDEGMNEKTTMKFVDAVNLFVADQAQRWALGLCIHLKEPDDNMKEILAIRGMQALVEREIEPYRGRFARQLRQEIRAVS